MMNKKGVELTLNTVIVGVLVVLALIVLTTFFLGGTAGITKTVRDIFSGTTSGIPETIAVQSCNNLCDQAKLLPETSWPKSAYCTKTFELDLEGGDGEADTKSDCRSLGVTCSDVENVCGEKVNEPITPTTE